VGFPVESTADFEVHIAVGITNLGLIWRPLTTVSSHTIIHKPIVISEITSSIGSCWFWRS